MFGSNDLEAKRLLSLECSRSIDTFLSWAKGELRLRPESLQKYRTSLTRIERDLGEERVLETFSKDDLWKLKARFVERGISDSWAYTSLMILRRFLGYARTELHAECLDPSLVTVPRRRRKEVDYLTSDEVERFVSVIKLVTQEGRPNLDGLRFRALVEMLLGSALRISELLSLNRGQIDLNRKEARIIGKGGRERVAFFTDRALFWLSKYLEKRSDECEALFANRYGRGRLKRSDVWRPFRRYKELAGIKKPLRPHILRHTAATQLLFNGCPIGHIKKILGHARLETTCRYYLGVDHAAAKMAHGQYLTYQCFTGIDVPSTVISE